MANETFLRFPHQIDVHSYNESDSPSGQVTTDFYFHETIKGMLSPKSTDRKSGPYINESNQYSIVVPRHFESKVSYNSRLYNVRDSHGEVIEEGPLEVLSLLKRPGYSGRTHHIYIIARVVVEEKG